MQSNITTFDRNKFTPFSIGFDDLFDKLFDMDIDSSNFPHYNINKVSETNFQIQIALAGYSKSDIEIQLADGELSVKSNIKFDDNKKTDQYFLHKGISKRNFIRKFTLSDEIFVKNAEMKDGMLTIKLEKIIPENKKPKFISIK
tara:strand:+ start:191 stop:622 length:432 start_codon:yes stop_codon:yes gene_type:complete